ncbi:hypothetical protein V6N12_016061 [Hibiscus sabdariffa]|uniref:Uncharacterized protein n=1 Tax=Hibiscus sabdariffa TaxID=183260 RepID=A0ABR2AMX7_9ROSI
MWKLALPSVSIQDACLWKNCITSFFPTLIVRNKIVLPVLYWSIWFSRNKLVHESIHMSADESVTFIEACIREQDTLRRLLPRSIPVRESYWQAPPESAIKFNFDLAFNSRSGSTTIGVIGLNNQGLIMAACSFPHRDVADVFVAEEKLYDEPDSPGPWYNFSPRRLMLVSRQYFLQKILAFRRVSLASLFVLSDERQITLPMRWLGNVETILTPVSGWKRLPRLQLWRLSLIGAGYLNPISYNFSFCPPCLSVFVFLGFFQDVHFQMFPRVS